MDAAKRQGRPRLADGEKRSERVLTTWTASELAAIKAAAADAGHRQVGRFVRSAVLAHVAAGSE
jgi:hypothetical protein